MKFRTLKPKQLTDAMWERWANIQTAHDALRSPYFRPEFTQAVAAVRDNVEIAVFERADDIVGFLPFERLGARNGRPVGGWLSDFHGPILDPNEPFDVAALMEACGLAHWDFTHLPNRLLALTPFAYATTISPYLDFSGGFDAYLAELPKERREEFNKRMRLIRKAERECGTLRFEFQVDDDQLFKQLLNLKSAQYHRTGLVDIFAFPWTVSLLERIRAARSPEFRGQFSALYLGDQLAALHFGMSSRGVLHYWFPTYVPELSHYAPGILLLMQLAKNCAANDLRRIELGKGDTHFKTSLASGAEDVSDGSVDLRCLSRSVRRRWWLTKRWIKESPLYSSVKLVKHRLLGLDGSGGVK